MQTVQFKQNTTSLTNRNLSPAIWANCPRKEMRANPGAGMFRYDDFIDLPLAPTLTTEIAFGKYKAYAATGCTISRVSAVNSVEIQGGCLQIATDTDDDEAAIADAYPGYLLSGLTTNSGRFWFECCYAQNSIATNLAASFIGLAETELYTLGANTPMNSGDAITNTGSMIGFRIEEDGLGVVDTVISDRATSFTNIGDTEGGTLVANTFKKFGMYYDPNDTQKTIRFFADNVELATSISKSTLTGYTNLDANALGFIWCLAADSAGTSFKGYMKWLAIAHEYANDA